MSSPDSARRHDLDALRATAMLLGIVLHGALSFTPFPWPVQDTRQNDSLFLLFAVLHGFRLSLFFILSGYFTAMLWRKRALQSLLWHRFRRILVPCLLGLVTIVPAVNWVSGAAMESAVAEATRPAATAGDASDIWGAARSGNVDAIEKLAAGGVDLNAGDPEFGATPLCWAGMLGRTEAVDALLESGAGVGARNADGGTALHGAAFLGRSEVVELLLRRGADVDARNNDGATALDSTKLDWGTTHYVAGLLRIDIDEKEVNAGRIEAAEFLVGGVARESSVAGAANMDIWAAARTGDVDAIKRAAAAGVDINARDPEFGVTPLCWAALLDHTRAVDALIESGADLEATNIDGATALHGAAFLGRVDSVELLLKRGAVASARDDNGSSPLDNTAADWQVTEYIAGLLRIEIDAGEVSDGRIKVAEALERSGGLTAGRPFGLAVKVARFTSAPIFSGSLFHHLWFLWHLCWLVLAFAGCVKIAEWLRLKRAPAWLVLTPVRFVWLIPLTMVPQYFMGVFSPHFGPDTSAGILPMPQVLLYYAIFFGYGALYFDCDDAEGRVGRWWWLTLPVGVFVVFPVGLEFSMGVFGFRDAMIGSAMHRPLAVGLQVLYAWMVSFGCMGLFRRLLSKESKAARYVSDSAYWLYVAHVPLIIGAQLIVRDWQLPVLVKFGLVCGVVTALLLLVYQTLVRYTVVGTLLNGPRHRPRPAEVRAGG